MEEARGRVGRRPEDEYVAAHHDGFLDGVSDHGEGEALLGAKLEGEVLEILPVQGVEGGKGLIHEEQVGPQGEGAGDGGALALAAGDLARVLVRERGNAQALQPGEHIRLRSVVMGGVSSVRSIEIADLKPQLHVLPDGRPGEEAIILEDEAGARTRARERQAIDLDGTGGRMEQTCQEIQESGLPAP
jgi:hypothetical protein